MNSETKIEDEEQYAVIQANAGKIQFANEDSGEQKINKDYEELAELLSGAVLSDKNIISAMKLGYVHISPFQILNLSTSSCDVTLGSNFYRESDYDVGQVIFNPYSKNHVERVWGQPQKAINAGAWMDKYNHVLEGIHREDEIIWLKHGETILAHTIEFIGGMTCFTTMMKTRSSLGRCFIEVCKCAGWLV
jgi:deoxycytidine triphosphate deaminase